MANTNVNLPIPNPNVTTTLDSNQWGMGNDLQRWGELARYLSLRGQGPTPGRLMGAGSIPPDEQLHMAQVRAQLDALGQINNPGGHAPAPPGWSSAYNTEAVRGLPASTASYGAPFGASSGAQADHSVEDQWARSDAETPSSVQGGPSPDAVRWAQNNGGAATIADRDAALKKAEEDRRAAAVKQTQQAGAAQAPPMAMVPTPGSIAPAPSQVTGSIRGYLPRS